MKSIHKYAVLNAGLTALYIVAIASFLFYGPKFFNLPQKDTIFMPIFMLSLFVFSASFTGSVFLGRPVLWYVDGRKKEALELFGLTLGYFFVFVLLVLGMVVMVR